MGSEAKGSEETPINRRPGKGKGVSGRRSVLVQKGREYSGSVGKKRQKGS